MRIYIAGPYRASTPEQVDANIRQARDAMAGLLRLGHTPFCPHSMTARFERDYPEIEDRRYLDTDLEWLRLCDGILMLPGSDRSSGAQAGLELAMTLKLNLFTSVDQVRRMVPS